ncbi:MAG: S-layer homology domain-containing protein, partial [Eubacteriales bacterium]|nr:S-layer homology domain-containing protein [Eubacteriales bacterium]
DISDSDVLAKDIQTLSLGGYINGYPDGSFRPEGSISRAEFVHIANGIFGYKGTSNISNLFGDVKTGAWYYDDVMIAQQAGYILGYMDGTFRPDAKISKEEVAAIFDRILSLDLSVSAEQISGIKVSDPISSWAKNSVLRVASIGLMPIDLHSNFEAKISINRGQVVYASARTLEKIAAGQIAPKIVAGLDALASEYDASVQRTIASLTKIMNDEVSDKNKFQKGDIAAEKALAKEVRDCMQSYLDNKTTFSSEMAAANIKVSYGKLSATSQAEFKRVVLANVDFLDLSKLRSFFGF